MFNYGMVIGEAVVQVAHRCSRLRDRPAEGSDWKTGQIASDNQEKWRVWPPYLFKLVSKIYRLESSSTNALADFVSPAPHGNMSTNMWHLTNFNRPIFTASCWHRASIVWVLASKLHLQNRLDIIFWAKTWIKAWIFIHSDPEILL